jgi:queuosine precursor transporter
MKSQQSQPEGRLLPVFSGIFSAVLVLIPSMSSKFISLGATSIAGSTLVFPITFILNDVLTEVYGYRRTRSMIWTGMAMQVFAAFFYWIIDIWPAADFWKNQQAYSIILGQAPRIVLASLTAYFIGEFANSYIISRMKHHQGGRRGFEQAYRFVLSTIVGEGLDSILFMTIAFLGITPNAELIKIILTIWAVKVIYEIVMLPISMKIANLVKQIEGVDEIDNPETTNYNPFSK